MGKFIPFMDRVDVRGHDECWLWLGPKMTSGYGTFRGGKAKVLAHRFSWELHNGSSIPDGMLCCHSCDNRICCNPHHIFIGSAADNTQDMISKKRDDNRKRCGTAYGRALTEDVVISCRKRVSSGETTMSIAKELGINDRTLQSAVIGKSWSHLPGAIRQRHTNSTK